MNDGSAIRIQGIRTLGWQSQTKGPILNRSKIGMSALRARYNEVSRRDTELARVYVYVRAHPNNTYVRTRLIRAMVSNWLGFW